MLISDSIAQLIEEMLSNGDGWLEIQRNDLAEKLGCVPSQINYVITSRFTPELGYIIESRRGGGGYIRIIKKKMHKDVYLMHFFSAIGDALDDATSQAFINNLFENDIITLREKSIIHNATSSNALAIIPITVRNAVRADIMRHIILSLMQ